MSPCLIGQIFLKPRYGSELGGTPVVVTGTNLIVADKDSVTCVFSHTETEGFVINEREVLCISPEMTKTGRMPFELRIDGEQSSITGSGVFIFCKSLNKYIMPISFVVHVVTHP